jgi:hypothetical protein
VGQAWEPIRPFRYTAVSWLSDRTDLRPMGRSEVELRSWIEDEIATAWYVPRPFGPGSDATLVVHAWKGNGNDGGVIKLSISEFNVVRDEDDMLYPPKPVMDMNLLSNPVRKDVPDDNGASEPDED